MLRMNERARRTDGCFARGAALRSLRTRQLVTPVSRPARSRAAGDTRTRAVGSSDRSEPRTARCGCWPRRCPGSSAKTFAMSSESEFIASVDGCRLDDRAGTFALAGKRPDRFNSGAIARTAPSLDDCGFAGLVPTDGFDAAPLSLSLLRCFDVSAPRASRIRWRDALQRGLQVLRVSARVHGAGRLAGATARAAKCAHGYALER
jgi:hypothetical protein